uniref:Uncharacterized protein n=1 Tax=Medicago truncatula TaxID=3880 RepID=A2Q6C6_MEDTR|nr:hypothetical protein MtrDRAFT_AC174467g26v1 [Medicago truncatula]
MSVYKKKKHTQICIHVSAHWNHVLEKEKEPHRRNQARKHMIIGGQQQHREI